MLRNLLNLLGLRRGGQNTGAQAERLAAEWLRREHGFTIVARNWRNPRDEREEIDLVCRDDDVLVFVEVKARSARARVPGYFAVTARKKRVLLRAAQAYLIRMRPRPTTFRLDVVEVTLPVASPGGKAPPPELRHFENVPLFPKNCRWI